MKFEYDINAKFLTKEPANYMSFFSMEYYEAIAKSGQNLIEELGTRHGGIHNIDWDDETPHKVATFLENQEIAQNTIDYPCGGYKPIQYFGDKSRLIYFVMYEHVLKGWVSSNNINCVRVYPVINLSKFNLTSEEIKELVDVSNSHRDAASLSVNTKFDRKNVLPHLEQHSEKDVLFTNAVRLKLKKLLLNKS